MGNIHPLFLDVAVVADGPKAPSASTQLRPMHKPSLASAGIYRQGRTPQRSRPGGRTTAVRQYHHWPLAGGE